MRRNDEDMSMSEMFEDMPEEMDNVLQWCCSKPSKVKRSKPKATKGNWK